MLTDEKSVKAGGHQPAHIGGMEDAALAHLNDAVGNSRRQQDGGFKKNLKRSKVAVIDADNFRAGPNCYFHLGGVVGFDERGHPVGGGQFAKPSQLRLVKDRHDQQDRIGSRGSGLGNVVFGNGEIFADDGQPAGRTRRAEIVETARKKVAVCQNGDRYCPALFVARGQFRRTKVFHQNTLTGGGFFNFGDDGRANRPESRCKIATRRPQCFSPCPQLGRGNHCLAQFFAFTRNNAGQDVGGTGGQGLCYRRVRACYLMHVMYVLYGTYVQLVVNSGQMAATITQFRKELFQLADQALQGKRVEFLYRGVVFKVIPDNKPNKSKLEKLVGQPVLAEGVDLEQATKELIAGMEAEWRKDWSEI
jgi:hypothetical protein